jgi:hypothetical protein
VESRQAGSRNDSGPNARTFEPPSFRGVGYWPGQGLIDPDPSIPAIIGRGVELGPMDISKVIPVYRFAKPTRALSKQT